MSLLCPDGEVTNSPESLGCHCLCTCGRTVTSTLSACAMFRAAVDQYYDNLKTHQVRSIDICNVRFDRLRRHYTGQVVVACDAVHPVICAYACAVTRVHVSNLGRVGVVPRPSVSRVIP